MISFCKYGWKDESSLLKCSPLQFHSCKHLVKFVYLVPYLNFALYCLATLRAVFFFSPPGQKRPYHQWPKPSHSPKRLETWLDSSQSPHSSSLCIWVLIR